MRTISMAAVALAGLSWPAMADQPEGFFSFRPDQTIGDISGLEWAPLNLQGLPKGIEIAVLRGDLAAGGGEIPLRTRRDMLCPITA